MRALFNVSRSYNMFILRLSDLWFVTYKSNTCDSRVDQFTAGSRGGVRWVNDMNTCSRYFLYPISICVGTAYIFIEEHNPKNIIF